MMEDFRIPFSCFAGRDDFQTIAREVLTMPGLPVGEISMPKLIKDQAAFSANLVNWSGSRAFGNGVYVFRKRMASHIVPVYVGQAPDEFLRRIFQHLDTRPKHGYGFNAMLQYVARDVLWIEDNQEGLQKALEWMLDGGSLVLIDMEDAPFMLGNYRRWEGALIRGMYAITQQPNWMQQHPKSRARYLKSNPKYHG